MKTFKCVQRYKVGNKIVGYKIADAHGNTRDVSSDKLKSVIDSGEALIVNLTLTADGRLILKDIPTQVENNKQSNSNNQSKVVSFESARVYKAAGTMLEGMLQCFNNDPEIGQIRITECEFGDDEKEEYALFVIQRERDEFEERSLMDMFSRKNKKYVDMEFTATRKKQNGQLMLDSPLNEYAIDDMGHMEMRIRYDMINLLDNEDKGLDKLRRIGSAAIADMKAKEDIGKSFGMVHKPDCNLVVAGNNIIYLRSLSDSPVVEIPEYVTVVCNGAFDFNHNLKQIKCPVHLFRSINKMIDAKKIVVEKIGRA